MFRQQLTGCRSQAHQAENLQHLAAYAPLDANHGAASCLRIIMMASTIAFDNDNSGLQAGTINGSVQASFHYATGRLREESFAGSAQALPCLLYERATFMNGPPHQLYPPTNSETTTPRRGDIIIQEAVRI